MLGRFKSLGLDIELSQDLAKKVVEHRNRYIRIFISRYMELLPSLIEYGGVKDTAIFSLKCEHMIRNNFDIIIGETTNGKIQLMGYVENHKSATDPTEVFESGLIKKDDIKFIISKDLIPKNMKEISFYDDCKTGNFVTVRNKSVTYVNDNEILQHFAIHIGELALSRFSVAMQSKLNTIFISQKNDETINQLVNKIYNGAPFVKVSNLFDPEDNIMRFDNEFMAQNFVELKREFQNQISELNNLLGIPSIGVEKASGVSDIEATANESITSAYGNIYLSSRQDSFDRLNKRYGLNLQALYNTNVARELDEIGKTEKLDPLKSL